MLKRSRVLAIILTLCLTFVLSACGQQPAPKSSAPAPQSSSQPAVQQSSQPAPAPAKEAPKDVIEIRSGYMPDLHGVTPLIIAEEKGYFKEVGLKVSLTKFLTGPPEIQAMVAGDLDIGYIGPGATPLVAQGQAKILTVDSTNAGDVVWATTKSGIKTIQDLKGKTIGCPKGSSAEMILSLALEKAGLKPEDVNVVNMDVAGSVAAFVAYKVDAVATWVPYTNEIEKQIGKENIVKLVSNKDFMPDYVFPQCWIVSNKFLEKNPEAVDRFMKAWVKANDYRMKNMDESVKLTSKFTQIPEDSLKVQVDTTNWIDSKTLNGYYKDGTIKKWYEGLQKIFVKTGRQNEVVDPTKFLVPGPMDKALK